jgi:hypothetical protein
MAAISGGDWLLLVRPGGSEPYDGRTPMVVAASCGFEFFGFLLTAIALGIVNG